VSAGLAVPEGRFEIGINKNRAQTDTAVIIPPLPSDDKSCIVMSSHNWSSRYPSVSQKRGSIGNVALIREHVVGLTTCPDSRP
jgi:hypothetical protein